MVTDPNKQAFVETLRQELEKDTIEQGVDASQPQTVEGIAKVMERPVMQKYFSGTARAFASTQEAIAHLKEIAILGELMAANESIMKYKQARNAAVLMAQQHQVSRENREKQMRRAMVLPSLGKLQSTPAPTSALNQIAKKIETAQQGNQKKQEQEELDNEEMEKKNAADRMYQQQKAQEQMARQQEEASGRITGGRKKPSHFARNAALIAGGSAVMTAGSVTGFTLLFGSGLS